MRNRSSKIRPLRRHSRQSRSTRSRSSGWMESSQPLPRNSSTVCPVIHRHSAESSSISPSGDATQTICAPPWTSARYRSSLRRSASSVAGPAPPAMTMSSGAGERAVRAAHPEPVERPLAGAARPPCPARAGLECLGRRAALREHLAQRGLCPGGVYRGPDGGDGLAGEVAGGAVVHPGERRVDPDEPQVGIEERHPGGRVAQHGIREPGFELTQSGLPLLRHGGVSAQPSTSPTVQAPATGGSFLLPRCQSRQPPDVWRQSADGAACLRHRSGPSDISVPQSRYRCCQLAAWKPSRESPPVPPPAPGGSRRHPEGSRKRDTDGIDAIRRHNDGSMGKFSYSG